MSAPYAAIHASPRPEIDRALERLTATKKEWLRVPPEERVKLLARLSRGVLANAERWVRTVAEIEGLDLDHPESGEEWLVGPYLVMRQIHILRRALIEISRSGRPHVPGPITTRPSGQVVMRVFPETIWDKLFFPGMSAEVWMDPRVTLDTALQHAGAAYHPPLPPARTCLVLGGGNVSSIGPLDLLTKLFVENQVVLYKAHPVHVALGPVFEEAFEPLLEKGYLQIVYGGVAEGAYLCEHPAIDEIHITGSEATYDAIVFGPGEEGARRRATRSPVTTKRVTGELGNVSPVIIVPGPWSKAELRYQAINIVSMLVNNAGFNCNAGRVIVQHAGWDQREALLDETRRAFSEVRTRRAYYPGARDRHARFLAAHPDAERFGSAAGDALPWTLIPHLDPAARDEICFAEEAFCGLIAETAFEAPSTKAFLERAALFCNDSLRGTLNATVVVHPATLREHDVRPAFERFLADLRYGTICVNHWASLGYALCSTPWGAYPGHEPHDIQSGTGFVHNAFMLSGVQKTIVRTLFRAFPRPPWFVDHKTAHRLGPVLTEFEAHPSIWKLPRVTWLAARA